MHRVNLRRVKVHAVVVLTKLDLGGAERLKDRNSMIEIGSMLLTYIYHIPLCHFRLAIWQMTYVYIYIRR